MASKLFKVISIKCCDQLISVLISSHELILFSEFSSAMPGNLQFQVLLQEHALLCLHIPATPLQINTKGRPVLQLSFKQMGSWAAGRRTHHE